MKNTDMIIGEAVEFFKKYVMERNITLDRLKLPERKNSTRPRKKKTQINASSLGRCPVAIRLEMEGHTPQFEEFVLKRMAEGTAIHDLFQSITERYWDGIEERYTDSQLVGHIDGRVGNAFIEIKSTSTLPQKPEDIFPKYWYQVGAYFRLTGLDSGYFIFIDKADLSNIRVFRMGHNVKDQLIQLANKKVEEVFSTNLTDVSFVGNHCNGCPMRHACLALEKHKENSIGQLDKWINSEQNL
ncbi:hypothetical protein [Persephonella sp.]